MVHEDSRVRKPAGLLVREEDSRSRVIDRTVLVVFYRYSGEKEPVLSIRIAGCSLQALLKVYPDDGICMKGTFAFNFEDRGFLYHRKILRIFL